MNTSTTNLEDLYARLALEEEDDGGVIVAKGEVLQQKVTYVLVRHFLTDKNINFTAMQNVLASLWRPRKGMEIHDIGGHRYTFVFYHPLDLQKVLEGGPWTFEQSLLVYHQLNEPEDPHLVSLNRFDIWVQVYDLPKGLIYENIFKTIGNFVGIYVKADPANISGGWKMYMRIRVSMDLGKPLKRRMKIKWKGGEWSWVNFKYERLSTFCFVCGMVGHSERDCGVVYANHEKEIARAYGVWLRAPTKNSLNQNLGARWLRNGGESSYTGRKEGDTTQTNATHSGGEAVTKFMEVDGRVSEVLGEIGGIEIVQRYQGNNLGNNQFLNQNEKIMGEENMAIETIITDPKRKRLSEEDITHIDGKAVSIGLGQIAGPKNLLEAGPVDQARLDK